MPCVSATETKKCDCGKVWEITRVKMPYGVRDNDSLSCTCGRELKVWSGGHTYTMEEVTDKTAA